MNMNNDILTLYYYRDGLTRDERQQLTTALASDDELARRYQEICQQLERLGNIADVPPSADMRQRWHDSIESAARTESNRKPAPAARSWSFTRGAGIAASLVIGIAVGIFVSSDPAVELPPAEHVAADSQQGNSVFSNNSSAFHRGLQVYFRESEQRLSAISVEASADRALLIRNIINQNRLYEKVAQQNDSQNLARVLRSFELALLKLTAEDITPEEAEAMQTKLLFELNVMLTKLARDTSNKQLSI